MPPILIFQNGTMTSCLDPESVKMLHSRATLMVTSPVDLLIAARQSSVDGTIYGLVSKLLSPAQAAQLSPNNALYNNPHEWLSALLRAAKTLAADNKRIKRMSNHEECSPQPAELVQAPQKSVLKFTLKSISGKVIHLRADKNPKRPNTKAYEVFDLYFKHAPISVEEYIDLGARMCDVKCDVEKGYVELREPEAQAAE